MQLYNEQHPTTIEQPEKIELIPNGLTILDVRENELQTLANACSSLTIKNADDKEGYTAVREHRIKLKNARVSIRKDGKTLREPAIEWQRKVIAREDQLVAIVENEESRLAKLEDQYDKWQEEIRVRKAREEQEFIQNRQNQLAQFGADHDAYELKIMAEEDFQALLGHAEAEWQKEQERKRIEQEETERKRREEEERLQREREELARQKAEQEKKEAELQAERDRLNKEFREREERLKKEQEQIEADKRAIELEKAKAEAAERAKREEQERIEREAKEKAERERLAKLEQERQEALKPDKVKLTELSARIMSIDLPELSHEESKQLLGSISEQLTHVSQYILREIKSL